MRGLSLRLKIVLLLAATLCASLLSYLWVGSELVVQDKLSYIFDFNLTEVKTVAGLLENRIERVRDTARWGVRSTENYQQKLAPLGVVAYAVLDERGGISSSYGLEQIEGRALSAWVSDLGWDTQWIRSKGSALGAVLAGLLPIGVVTDAGQTAIAFLRFGTHATTQTSSQVELHLVDALGHASLLSPARLQAIAPDALQKFEAELVGGGFPEGVREWSGQIVAYQKLKFQDFVLVSYASREAAYRAVEQLKQRSLVLGVSIFFLALGLTLLFVKGITSRLRQMWSVTRKVAQGDFKVRVDTHGTRPQSRDEVESLAHSFNAMASKIDDLMIQTAQKARMEKELETAQAVQSRFFPTQELQHPHLQVGGLYVPASECAGDWWNCVQIGEEVLLVIGDVTGHGVSSALVTASVHGAFSAWRKRVESSGADRIPLADLVQTLNTAVRASAGGGTTMTLGALVFDTRTGVVQVANASHIAPYVFSPSEVKGDQLIKAVRPLEVPVAPALGRGDAIVIEPYVTQLAPGELLLWATDGFFEGPAAVGKSVSNRKLLKLLIESARNNAGRSMQQGCRDAYQGLQELMANTAERPDDITLLFAEVPASAKFLARAA